MGNLIKSNDKKIVPEKPDGYTPSYVEEEVQITSEQLIDIGKVLNDKNQLAQCAYRKSEQLELLTFEELNSGAVFSPDRKYRYKLWRRWDTGLPIVMFVGLNPSTANETECDPTVRRCINFAKSWGYGGMFMANMFAYVSTDPDQLKYDRKDILDNNIALMDMAVQSEMIVLCCGAFKQHTGRMKDVISLFDTPYCLKITKDGYPSHPLYLKGDLKPIKFRHTGVFEKRTEF